MAKHGVLSRVGGRNAIRAEARIVCATNVDLEERMRPGQFLRDLHDRLTFEVISVPALRDREDYFEQRVLAYERSSLMAALERASGNGAEAARAFGLPHHRFRYLYQKLCAHRRGGTWAH